MDRANIIEIDTRVLRENYHAFAKFGKVYFPVKTCHNEIVLGYLRSMGCGFEVDSIDHMKKVLNDTNADNIIYSNVAKSDEDIEWAVAHGVNFFTIDDGKTLNRIIYHAKKYSIHNIRINVRLNVFDIFRYSFIRKGVTDSRLGSSVKVCKDLLARARAEKDVSISAGLSFYVQAEMHDKEDMLLTVTKYILRHFDASDGIKWLNIGGGSRIKTLHKYHEIISDRLRQIGINRIILEPGRYMVDGVMTAYVPPIRCIHKDSFGGEMVVTLGMGIYHGMIDIKLHKREFDIYILRQGKRIRLKKIDHVRRIIDKSSPSHHPIRRIVQENNRLVLRGPTADSIDIIGVYEMPYITPTEEDTFVIDNIGAYMEVLISQFSGSIAVEYRLKGVKKGQ